MNFKILLLMFVLLLGGCATAPTQRPILQLDGQPISDKIVRANLLLLEPFIVKYQLAKRFRIVEGQEFYESQEYLDATSFEIHKIKEDEELVIELILFNPTKHQYKVVQHINIEGGSRLETVEYKGSLTRNNFKIVLPYTQRRKVEGFFEILNDDGHIVYQSFTIMYEYEMYENE